MGTGVGALLGSAAAGAGGLGGKQVADGMDPTVEDGYYDSLSD